MTDGQGTFTLDRILLLRGVVHGCKPRTQKAEAGESSLRPDWATWLCRSGWSEMASSVFFHLAVQSWLTWTSLWRPSQSQLIAAQLFLPPGCGTERHTSPCPPCPFGFNFYLLDYHLRLRNILFFGLHELFFYFCLFVLFWKQELYNLSCPGTHKDPPASGVLGFKGITFNYHIWLNCLFQKMTRPELYQLSCEHTVTHGSVGCSFAENYHQLMPHNEQSLLIRFSRFHKGIKDHQLPFDETITSNTVGFCGWGMCEGIQTCRPNDTSGTVLQARSIFFKTGSLAWKQL